MKITIEGSQEQFESIDFSFVENDRNMDDQPDVSEREDTKPPPFDTLAVGDGESGFSWGNLSPEQRDVAKPWLSPPSAPQQPLTSPDPIFFPATIIIDTREQMPWHFKGLTKTKVKTIKGVRHKISHPLIVPTKSSTLQSGDYSLEGLESNITIERKSLSDLFGTLLTGRDRFKRELERLADENYSAPNGYSAVVVEASLSMLINNNEYEPSKIKSVIGSIMAFDQRYQTSWWFLPTRVEAERFCFRALERFWNDREGKQKSA